MGEIILMHTHQLELEHVSVTPLSLTGDKGKPILKDIAIQVQKGEWITLIGRNGSGKSTLAKVIAGFPLQKIHGRIKRAPEESGRDRKIPIVMQQPEAGMIGSTPWEDVVLMLERHGAEESRITARAEEMLRKVGLAERMKQPVETLSGGQKQLVAIAGCLAVDAPMLILDEITAMLDPEASAYVLEQVRVLNEAGVTVIWITQRQEELRGGDRIVAMQDGSIVYDGFVNGWFQRATADAKDSPCEALGFEAPYTVRVAWELEERGIRLSPTPVTADELAEAVNRYEC